MRSSPIHGERRQRCRSIFSGRRSTGLQQVSRPCLPMAERIDCSRRSLLIADCISPWFNHSPSSAPTRRPEAEVAMTSGNSFSLSGCDKWASGSPQNSGTSLRKASKMTFSSFRLRLDTAAPTAKEDPSAFLMTVRSKAKRVTTNCRNPLNSFGCGGSQPAEFGILLGSSVERPATVLQAPSDILPSCAWDVGSRVLAIALVAGPTSVSGSI